MNALQRQASENFAPAWGIDARLNFVPSSSAKGWQGKWNLIITDTSDEAGALGYHDLTPDGLPVGKVFAKTDLQYGAKWSVTASHELTEMLLDPWINLTAFDPRRGLFVAFEAADAVEADELGYTIDGVLVSDFVLPAFFDPTALGRKNALFSWRSHVSAPFQLAAGGYESVFVPGRGWSQNTAREGGALPSDRPKVGSRRERRVAAAESGLAAWNVSPADGPLPSER